MQSEIPFIRPSFPSSSEIATDIDDIVQTNWYTNFGPKEKQFAHGVEDHLGQGLHVATFANGTLALIAALHCTLGRGEWNKHLLMPSFTFIAVAQAAIWNGYHPWFIDIDPVTWQASVGSARGVLESSRDQVAGILLANAFGVGNPHIGEWEELAAEWELPMVIDSAAGFGSKYEDGRFLGARGACEIFSFHSTKPFGIGEGGALATRDRGLVDRAYDFQNVGFDRSRTCTQLGINGKLPELSAAIGLRQLIALDQRLASRRATFDSYRMGLAGLGLNFQPNADNSSHFCLSMCVDSVDKKAAALRSLSRRGIQARDYYNPPLHRHPYFFEDKEISAATELQVTEDVCSRIISLPIHDNMAPHDIERVVMAVVEGVTQ
jgi:dTDP-4-amino-4,6-dideoxygalactose transaminase